jgi:hypothetical protein
VLYVRYVSCFTVGTWLEKRGMRLSNLCFNNEYIGTIKIILKEREKKKEKGKKRKKKKEKILNIRGVSLEA